MCSVHMKLSALLDSSESVGVVCMVSPYRDQGSSPQSGVAAYTESLVTAVTRTQPVTVLAQRSAETVSAGNLIVHPAWSLGRGGSAGLLSYVQILRPRVIHVQHEFRIFGSFIRTMLAMRRIGKLRREGVALVVTLHGVIDLTTIDSKFRSRNRVHAPVPWVRLGVRFASRDIRRMACLVIVHHERFADVLVEQYKFSRDDIYVIPMGRGVGIAERSEVSTRQRGSNFRVLCFGYLTSYKDFELVVSVAERGRLHGVTFVFCVSERLPKNIRTKSRRLTELEARVKAVGSTVEWRGYVADDEVASVFAGSDLLLLPYTDCVSISAVASLAESFGIPICHSEPIGRLLGSGPRMFQLNVESLEAAIGFVMKDSGPVVQDSLFPSWEVVAEMTKNAWVSAGHLSK